ncbi:ABC transporter substrate-binding protein [Hymenobacter sp.]|uniref:ABC transporter substrate-binding protein n=1 Tax=Hymenobacter sp. TaxID=1898978 RepID=UPI00286D62DE|nr:ABC transporter substrate-binding protein [Hymenobacter sp.]
MAIEATNLLHLSLLQVDITQQKYTGALAVGLPTTRLVGDSLTQLDYCLRPAAAWDDGHPVLASDVAFSLKLIFCPGLPNEAARARFGFIEAVTPDPINPRQFTLVCRGQSTEYLLASGDFFILPEATLDPRGQLRHFSLAELQQRPAAAPADTVLEAVAQRYATASKGQLPGCGPYQLVKWEKDRRLSFRRKPMWWASQGRPTPFVLQAKPKQLEYVVIPDAATTTLALRRGDLDVYPQMPAREFARLRASSAARATLNFYSTSSYDVVLAGFNTRRPALADALTRQALNRCFDAASLLQATQLGGGQRTVGVISPADRTNYNDSLPLVPFDPDGATRLLRRAGWQGGAAAGWFRAGPLGVRQQLRLMVRYRADETMFATIALQFQAAAARVGIPATLRPTESGAFTAALQTGDFDVYVRILKGNPFMFNYIPIFHSLGVGAGNTTGFHTAASDRLIEAIAAANGQTQRGQLLRRFQALMQQEVPVAPLFFVSNRIAADRRLTGLHVNSLKPGYSAATIERAPQPSPVP